MLLDMRVGRKKINGVDDVAAWQLCCGCGACAYICPDEIEMIDTLEYGRRPRSKGNSSPDNSRLAMRICPGIELSHQSFNSETIPELRQAWGQVLEVWEGYATDPEIRFKGSSGGVATALALFGLEKGKG